ncbi:hypothetical protein N9Y92_02635 [Chlamydiales bacterium]|nr:hypothetical protein [Chlamydiales bacterium]
MTAVFHRVHEYWSELPSIALKAPDSLDKTVKIFMGNMETFHNIYGETETNNEGLRVLKTTSKWLTGSLIFGDFEKRKTLRLGNNMSQYLMMNSFHLAHLFDALNLWKDLGVGFLGKLDQNLGNMRFFEIDVSVSMKSLKDLFAIVGSFLAIASVFHTFFYDNNGFPRENLSLGLISEEMTLTFLNNSTKVYVLGSVALKLPWTKPFGVLGSFLGVTSKINEQRKFEVDDKKSKERYERELVIANQLLSVDQAVVYRRA